MKPSGKISQLLLLILLCISTLSVAKARFPFEKEKNGCKAAIDTVDVLKNHNFLLPHIALADNAIADKINNQLSFDQLTGSTIKELQYQQKVKADGGGDAGFSGIDFQVRRNEGCILSITVTVTEASELISASEGRYHIVNHYLTFDLATGTRITIEDVVKKEELGKLTAMCDKKLQQHYLAARNQHRELYKTNDYKGYKFEKDNLVDFWIGAKGIYFFYDFSFFNCDRPVQPDGVIMISKEEIKGLLAPRYTNIFN